MLRRIFFFAAAVSSIVVSTSAARAQEAPAKADRNSGVASHAYGGVAMLRPTDGDARGAGAMTFGLGGGTRSVKGFGDLAFLIGSRSDRTYAWSRFGPTIEGRIGRFVIGGGMAVGLLFGWASHDYVSGGLGAIVGADVVRFGDGALRVLLDLRGDAFRETAVAGSRAPNTFEAGTATLLLGYRAR